MSEQGTAHATTGTYLRIAAVLVMITLIEVGVFYVPAFQGVLVPVLLVLSAVKFTLVVMFYMHLKFDNRFLHVSVRRAAAVGRSRRGQPALHLLRNGAFADRHVRNE